MTSSVKVFVRLTPKSSAERIDGWDMDDRARRFLKIRVRAAPVEGRANEALITFLAKSLKLPKSRLSLVSGDTARLKQIKIEGLEEADLNAF